MATTTEGTGPGAVERVIPRLVNGVVRNVPVINQIKQTVQQNTNEINQIKQALESTTAEFFVAKHGSDSNVGSAEYPFLTIQKAVDYAEENLNSSLGYIIKVKPGFYPETVTLTRAKAHLCGTHTYNDMTMFCSVSRIEINCVEDMGGSSNTQYSISGMLVTPSSGNCISITGDVGCTIIIKDCNLYASSNGQKCLTNNNSGDVKTKINGVVFNNKLADAHSIDVSSGWLDIQRCFIYNGNSSAVNFSGSVLTVDGVLMQGSGSNVLTISGSGQVNVSNSLLETSASNANGFNITGNATCTCVQNVFRVPSGSGYAANGVAGAIFIHALNVFLPTFNNKFRSLMTNVAASTTPTLS